MPPCAASRRGLSTLEMVMALPILLFVMALMVNFGTVADWKVRGLLAARHAGWGSRDGHNAAACPRPDYWPAGAGMGSGGSPDAANLDDPRVDHPVARGASLPLGNRVNRDLLDPSRGMRNGASNLVREFPMLRRMGAYTLDTHVNMLDGFWRYGQMGLTWNNDRRIPVLYALATDVPAQYPMAFLQAAIAILQPGLQRALRPLDNDEEFVYYSRRFRWGDLQPSFYRLFPAHLCTLDHARVKEAVTQLVDEIQGKPPSTPSVAKSLAEWFRDGLYQRAIDELKRLLAAAPPGQGGAIQAEIDALEAKRKAVDEFAQSIQ